MAGGHFEVPLQKYQITLQLELNIYKSIGTKLQGITLRVTRHGQTHNKQTERGHGPLG